MQASKWLQCQVLIDGDEMENLFSSLEPFFIFKIGALVTPGEGVISQKDFLDIYRRYVETLEEGCQPEFHSYFSAIFTASIDCIYAMALDNGQHLIRLAKPVIQLQPHRIGWSEADRKFRPMVMGVDSISWGIQFSYPQLFHDNTTKQVVKIDTSEKFPNTALFHKLQRWVRYNTIPTPFVVKKEKINVPMRLGKHCLAWINKHPQLIKKGIVVA